MLISRTEHVDTGFLEFHRSSSFKMWKPFSLFIVSPFGDLYNVPDQKRRHFVRLREQCVVKEAVLRGEKRVSAVFCPLSKRGLRVFRVFLPKTIRLLSRRR